MHEQVLITQVTLDMCTCNLQLYGTYIVLLTLYYYHCTVPSQVTGVVVSKATRSRKPALRVTWTTPQSDVIILQYQVEYRRQGTSSWRKINPVSSGSNMATIHRALDAGISYEVRIRAVSAIGNGTWSEMESETTYKSEFCSELKLVGVKVLNVYSS